MMDSVIANGNNRVTTEQCPEKEPPVVDTFDAADAQLINGAPQGQDILRLKLELDLGLWVLAEERQNALVIEFGRVDMA